MIPPLTGVLKGQSFWASERAVFVMNKAKELAKSLGISESAARKRLQRKVDTGQPEVDISVKSGHEGVDNSEKVDTINYEIVVESGQVDIPEEKVDNGTPPYKALKPDGRFEEVGRGCVRNGMVMISLGWGEEDIMVSESDWRARMDFKCPHKLSGWSCKRCL